MISLGREHEFTSKKCTEADLNSYLLINLLISYLLQEFFQLIKTDSAGEGI